MVARSQITALAGFADGGVHLLGSLKVEVNPAKIPPDIPVGPKRGHLDAWDENDERLHRLKYRLARDVVVVRNGQEVQAQRFGQAYEVAGSI